MLCFCRDFRNAMYRAEFRVFRNVVVAVHSSVGSVDRDPCSYCMYLHKKKCMYHWIWSLSPQLQHHRVLVAKWR